MKYAHPLDIVEAVTRPLSDEELAEPLCRQCNSFMSCPPDLEPTPFCNPCAQAALVVLAEAVQGKYIDRQLERLAHGTAPAAQADPAMRPGWEPPGGLNRPRRGRRKR